MKPFVSVFFIRETRELELCSRMKHSWTRNSINWERKGMGCLPFSWLNAFLIHCWRLLSCEIARRVRRKRIVRPRNRFWLIELSYPIFRVARDMHEGGCRRISLPANEAGINASDRILSRFSRIALDVGKSTENLALFVVFLDFLYFL